MRFCLRRILLVSAVFIGLPAGLIGFQLPEDIPVRAIGHGLLVAPVSLNGQGPFDFVIDTGTNTTLIDPALAARLALPAEGVESLSTLTGPVRVQRYRVASVAAGSQEVHNLFALGQHMTAVQKLDKRINGILGLEFLAHFSFGLDYAKLRLRLYAAAAPYQAQRGTRVPAQLLHDRLLLTLTSAEPQRSWRLALDSGTSQILIFLDEEMTAGSAARQGECFSALRLEAVCREKTGGAPLFEPAVRVTSNQSELLSKSIVLRSVAIGDLRLKDVPAVLLRDEDGTAHLFSDGVLPACLFHSFFFDHATSTIIFNPD